MTDRPAADDLLAIARREFTPPLVDGARAWRAPTPARSTNPFDNLIDSTGVAVTKPLLHTTEDEWRRVLDTH